MVFHGHPAVSALDLVVGGAGGNAEDRIGGLVVLPVEHRDDGVDIRIAETDHGSYRLQDRFLGLAEVPVGRSDLHKVMEQLQPLRGVHVGSDLVAYRVDVDLLAVEAVQHPHSLVNRGFTEIAADELAHTVEFRLRDLAVGLDDGGGQDQQTDKEAVALLSRRITAAGGGCAVGRLAVASGLTGVTAIAGAGAAGTVPAAIAAGAVAIGAARPLPGDVNELIDGRAYEVTQQGPYGSAGHPAQETDYPFS